MSELLDAFADASLVLLAIVVVLVVFDDNGRRK